MSTYHGLNRPAVAPERARLELLIDRDGLDGARAWARRTLGIYRAALADRPGEGRRGHFACGRGYRREFVRSCLAFRTFLRAQDGQDGEIGS